MSTYAGSQDVLDLARHRRPDRVVVRHTAPESEPGVYSKASGSGSCGSCSSARPARSCAGPASGPDLSSCPVSTRYSSKWPMRSARTSNGYANSPAGSGRRERSPATPRTAGRSERWSASERAPTPDPGRVGGHVLRRAGRLHVRARRSRPRTAGSAPCRPPEHRPSPEPNRPRHHPRPDRSRHKAGCSSDSRVSRRTPTTACQRAPWKRPSMPRSARSMS